MSTQTFNDVIITGRIIFNDNTTQDTSATAVINKCAKLERNADLNSLSLLQDKLIVNNSIETNNLITDNLRNNSITFLNDLDNNGFPKIQNRCFDGEIINKINNNKTILDSLIPDIIDPPNKKIKLEILDNVNGNYKIDFYPDVISLTTNSGGSFENNITADHVHLQNIDKNKSITYSGDNIIINGGPDHSVSLNSENLTINNGVVTYSQLHGDKLKISDSYGIISQLEIYKDSIISTNLQNSQNFQIDNGTNLSAPTIQFNNPLNQTTSILRDDYLIIQKNVNDKYYSFNENLLQVNNTITPSYIRMSPDEGFSIQNSEKGGSYSNITTISHSNININNNTGGGPSCNITSGDCVITDNGGIMRSTLTSDYLQLENMGSPVTTQYLNNGINYYNTEFTINGNNVSNFLRFNSGKIDRCQIIDQTVGSFIEPNSNYYLTEKGDCILYAVKQYFSTTPQDNGTHEGWYCYITNISGRDITLYSEDSKNFVAHSNGVQSGSTTIKKYSTVRVTLLFSINSFNDYFWSVSSY